MCVGKWSTLVTFWVFGLSGGFMGADFIFRLYNLHTRYIFFCKKIKKIKHMTINIMTTRGIFHCTIMTIDSLVPVRRSHANAVGLIDKTPGDNFKASWLLSYRNEIGVCPLLCILLLLLSFQYCDQNNSRGCSAASPDCSFQWLGLSRSWHLSTAPCRIHLVLKMGQKMLSWSVTMLSFLPSG